MYANQDYKNNNDENLTKLNKMLSEVTNNYYAMRADMLALLSWAHSLRNAQTQYFKTKNNNSLEVAKQLEKDFDNKIKALQSKYFPTPNLFNQDE